MNLHSLPGQLLRRFSLNSDHLLRDPEFLRVWLASTFAVLGGSVSQLALPLTAVQILHAGPLEMGVLFACGALPFVLFSLPAGVWIDRCDRRTLIVLFNLIGAGALLLVPVAAHFGWLSMPLLCLVELLVGTGFCIGGSAQQVFLTQIVGRDRLLHANSLQAVGTGVAGLMGPILAGMLVGWLGAPIAVAIDAAMFLGSAGLIGSITSHGKPNASTDASVFADAMAGLRFVWNHPLLRSFALMAAMCIFLFDGFMALYVLHATRNLHLSPEQLAVVNTLAALGALVGAFLAPVLSRRLGKYLVVSLGLGCAAVGYIGFSMVAPGERALISASLALFLVDAGMTAYTVNYLALRQLATPDALLGRMTATMRFLSVSAAPVGSGLAGYFAERHGIPAVLLCFGILGVLAAVTSCYLIHAAVLAKAPDERFAACDT